MRAFIKYSAYTIATVAVLIFVVANYSSRDTNFECHGELTFDGQTQNKTIFIKLSDYRWWVGLWSESDASLNLEIPNEHFDYYSKVDIVGDLRQIYDYNKNLKGQFSLLSKTLSLDTRLGFYDGVCTETR